MGKNNNKKDDIAQPASNKLSSKKNFKTSKEKQKDNIIIRKTTLDYEKNSRKVKILASDHFSESAGKTKMVEPNSKTKKVCLLQRYGFLLC